MQTRARGKEKARRAFAGRAISPSYTGIRRLRLCARESERRIVVENGLQQLFVFPRHVRKIQDIRAACVLLRLIHASPPRQKRYPDRRPSLLMVRVEPVRELVSVLIKKGAVNRARPGGIGTSDIYSSANRFFVTTSTARIDDAHIFRPENAKGSEYDRLCSRKGRCQMRMLLVTACLIALVISAWSNYSSVADAKLRGDVPVSPTSQMSSTHH